MGHRGGLVIVQCDPADTLDLRNLVNVVCRVKTDEHTSKNVMLER